MNVLPTTTRQKISSDMQLSLRGKGLLILFFCLICAQAVPCFAYSNHNFTSFINSIQLYYFNSDVLIFQNPFSSFQPIFFEDLLFELNYHEALKVFDFL
jgi:hypothetical protein